LSDTDAAAAHRFREDGYVILPDVFDATETKALQQAFQELVGAGKLHNVATDSDRRTRLDTKVNLQVCPLSHHHPFFAALPFQGRVRALVTALLGGPSYKFLDQIFYKPGRVGSGTNWHQDNNYFGVEYPFIGLGFWVAIHDATAENGTLQVLPRRFHARAPHVADPESDHHDRMYPEDEGEAVVCEVPAGGAVAFCFNIPHRTTGNRTDRGRAGAAFHFMRCGHTGPFNEGSNPHAEFPLYGIEGQAHGPIVSGPTYTKGVQEYGRDMEAQFAQETARLAAAHSPSLAGAPA